MIYDIHTHFWNNTDVSPDVTSHAEQAGGVTLRFTITSEMHLEETKAVDKSVVFGLRGVGINVPNDTVKAQVDLAPERFVFFTSVNPAEEGFMEELERTHQDLGARGIKLGPIYQGIHPRDDTYCQIYSYAQKHGLPIVIHMATTFTHTYPLEYARPIHMDEIAIEYPELKIVIAHLGHPWISETIAIIRRQPHVYADISALYYRPWQFYNAMMLLVEYGTWKKVFFGSDFPFTKPSESIAGVRNVNHFVETTRFPKIPEEVIEGILHSDSFSVLGIS
ncbi:MAG TPA: amidohydrolase family protein [Anaerolineae bacterium]|nr:amidohydrolase family protein [Anaerolineae bacterium]